jgi:hypothetical protein
MSPRDLRRQLLRAAAENDALAAEVITRRYAWGFLGATLRSLALRGARRLGAAFRPRPPRRRIAGR